MSEAVIGVPDGEADPGKGEDAFLDPLAVEDGVGELCSGAVFEGDRGTLSLEQRQVLVNVLKKRMISAEANQRDWAVLVADEGLIRGRLNDMFLDLVVDHERGVAYKVQVRHPVAGTFPPLLHDVAYNREETILLVFLRQRYASERASGQERVFVDREECVDSIAGFRPVSATNVVGDQSRANNAVDTMVTNGILMKPGQEGRFRISPVIEVLLPVHELRNLLDWLMEQNSPERFGTRDESTEECADDHDA